MRIVVSSRGSRGDVYPILAVGIELQRRGHSVCVSAPVEYADRLLGSGVEFFGYEEDSGEVMQGLGAGWRAGWRALRFFRGSLGRPFDALLELAQGADALVTSVNEAGAPSIGEFLGIPHFRVAYAPILTGDQTPPLLPWQGLPRHANLFMWSLLNAGVEALLSNSLNLRRAQLGLRPVGATADYFAGMSHTLLAIDERLGPSGRGWRHSHSYTGYCFDDSSRPMSKRLREFLAAGPPPIYLGFGSVSLPDPLAFTRMVIQALRRSGLRAVLGSGWTGLGGGTLPETVCVVEDLSHADLFPQMVGVAHHGGSGTVHNGLAAGVPQFVMPQLADQFYWGHRVAELGLGPKPIRPEHLNVTRMAHALREMVHRTDFAVP